MIPGIFAATAGTGGSPPTPPAFDPSILSGLTFAFWPGESDMYAGWQANSGPVLDGQKMGRGDSMVGIQRIVVPHTNIAYPILADSAFGSGRPGLHDADLENGNASVARVRPVGNASPNEFVSFPDLFGDSSKLLLWAGVIDDIGNNSGSPDGNDYLVAGSTGYWGLHAFKVGGAMGTDARLQWYNYSVNYHTITADVPLGTPFVVACRHAPPNVFEIAVNGVNWNTRSSGATSSTGGRCYLLPKTYAFTRFDVTTAAVVTCNDPNDDADVLAVVKQMGGLVGLSL